MNEVITKEMEVIKSDIIKVVDKKDSVKSEIEVAKSAKEKLSKLKELSSIDLELSKLDTKYKILWDRENIA